MANFAETEINFVPAGKTAAGHVIYEVTPGPQEMLSPQELDELDQQAGRVYGASPNDREPLLSEFGRRIR